MNAKLITECLDTMTREELSRIAKVAKVSVGKSKSDTVFNIASEVVAKRLRFNLSFTVSKINPKLAFNPVILMKKLKSDEVEEVLAATS